MPSVTLCSKEKIRIVSDQNVGNFHRHIQEVATHQYLAMNLPFKGDEQ